MLAHLAALLHAAADLAAQEFPAPASGWTLDGVAKVGLGVASFVAFVGLCIWIIRYLLTERTLLTTELSVARTAYFASLDRQHAEHKVEIDEVIAHWENRDEKVREKIHLLTNAVQTATGAMELVVDRIQDLERKASSR